MGVVFLTAVLLLTGVMFGGVVAATRPRSEVIGHRHRLRRTEDVVRRACADLDREYRQLLGH